MTKTKNQKPTILIAEDERIVAKDLQQEFEDAGYLVLSISDSGLDIIKKAKKFKPDLIVMDIVLKGEMDGIEAATKILQTESIPIIFVSGFADKKRLKRAIQTRPYSYILKPFNTKELLIAIEIALHKEELRMKLERIDKEKAIYKEQFETIFNHANSGIAHVDMNGRFKLINKKFCDLLGYSKDEMLKTTFQEVTNVSHLSENKIKLEEVIQKKRNSYSLDMKVLKKNDKSLWINLTVKLIMSKVDKSDFLILIVSDITAQKDIEKELLEKIEEMEYMGKLQLKRHHELMGLESENKKLKKIIAGKRSLGSEKPDSRFQQKGSRG